MNNLTSYMNRLFSRHPSRRPHVSRYNPPFIESTQEGIQAPSDDFDLYDLRAKYKNHDHGYHPQSEDFISPRPTPQPVHFEHRQVTEPQEPAYIGTPMPQEIFDQLMQSAPFGSMKPVTAEDIAEFQEKFSLAGPMDPLTEEEIAEINPILIEHGLDPIVSDDPVSGSHPQESGFEQMVRTTYAAEEQMAEQIIEHEEQHSDNLDEIEQAVLAVQFSAFDQYIQAFEDQFAMQMADIFGPDLGPF